MVEIQGIPVEFLSFGNIVNGQKITLDRDSFTGTNPKDGTALWKSPVAVEQDVELALQAASHASRRWATTTFEERSKVLIEWADKIKENYSKLVPLIEIESGKPVSC
jgi:acyl-CoA reductase-like NAD-dependent aldehyde dehydrogenase